MSDNATIEQERELLARFKSTREHKESTAAVAADASKEHEAVKAELIKFLVDNGKPNVEYEGLGKASLTTHFSATVEEEHREKFREWLREKGYGAIIKEAIDYRTLSSTIKEMLKEGEDIPEYVKQSEFSNISYRAG